MKMDPANASCYEMSSKATTEIRTESPLIGVVITTHNERSVLERCLDAIAKSEIAPMHIVVVDDGSNDGTREWLESEQPNVCVLYGDGNLWWTGGTNLGIRSCLLKRCQYILLLNADVTVEHDTVGQLLMTSRCHCSPIVASVVVPRDEPSIVWWAGSHWAPLIERLPLVWVSRYLFKRGTPVSDLPSVPFETSEVHGRAVLVPRIVFDTIGLYDSELLPHYGADTDFSFRARRAGYHILVDPNIRVRLHIENTGLKTPDNYRFGWREYWKYLTQRKNGEALRVWWHITQRHLPWYSAIPTYLSILSWNTLRFWSAAVRRTFSGKVE